MTTTTAETESAKRSRHWHTEPLAAVRTARGEYDRAERALDLARRKLIREVSRGLDKRVPPTYLAEAAGWSRAQVHRVQTGQTRA